MPERADAGALRCVATTVPRSTNDGVGATTVVLLFRTSRTCFSTTTAAAALFGASCCLIGSSRYNLLLLTVDFLIRLVGGSDNRQLELVLVISNWLTLLLCYVY